jgi:hypothetical protein
MRHWEEARFVSVEISIRRKVRQCSSISQEDFNEDDFLKLTFAIKALSIWNNQSVKKDWWNWDNLEKYFENRSM